MILIHTNSNCKDTTTTTTTTTTTPTNHCNLIRILTLIMTTTGIPGYQKENVHPDCDLVCFRATLIFSGPSLGFRDWENVSEAPVQSATSPFLS